MSLWEAFILGCVQALTEFLPVSSSGHLVLAQSLMESDSIGGGAAFEVAVHLGTLLSILCLFWRDVLDLLIGFRRPTPEWRQLLQFILLGSVPAGVIGLLFKDELEAAFSSTTGVGVALCLTGLILLSTLRLNGSRVEHTWRDALWIGCAQAVAILPGISRSGSTIAAALALGISRAHAARLSFLMSIPVVAGAGVLKGLDLLETPPSSDVITALWVGGGTAFIVGLGALQLMLRWVQRPAFSLFGLYCLGVGLWATFL
jgi:undecaprenyl-diphosphatase